MNRFGVLTGTFSKKTKLSWGVYLLAVAVSALFAAFVLWALAFTPVFIGLASAVRELCHGIFTQCLGYAGIVRLAFFWAGGGLLLSGLLFATCRAAVTLIKSARAIKRLPIKNKEAKVLLIEDRTISTAFTHGIVRPRIYISRGLMETLDKAELRAVLHHELCHKKNRDPLRFFLLSILKDTFFFVPLAAHLYGLIGDSQERKADDVAAYSMREPYSIAGALVKLGGASAARPVETASILGRHGSVEDRIKRLMGEEARVEAGKGPRAGAILASLIIPVFMLISLAMPLKDALPPRISTCSTTHCSKHKENPDKHCHTHCEKTGRIGRIAPIKTLSDVR